MLRRRFLQFAGSSALIAASASRVRADETRLVVDTAGDGSDLRAFTDADLMALPQISFTTSTIWTNAEAEFSGPSLAAVLAAAGAGDGDLRMTAVNDYKVDMPRGRVEDSAPIVANRIDGAPFGIRDKGPLWLVFPFDSDARFQTEEVYSFSIWQLTQIQILKA
ncbi:MAG: oxidoreductase [Rhodobacterales bacterium]|nr:oxidoreductase [Rhodobacterales bacterium]